MQPRASSCRVSYLLHTAFNMLLDPGQHILPAAATARTTACERTTAALGCDVVNMEVIQGAAVPLPARIHAPVRSSIHGRHATAAWQNSS